MTPWDRWCDLWERLGAKGDQNVRFAQLSDRYSEPHRAYHTLAHVESCLAEFDAVRGMSSHPNAVDYAIWFHDVVFDPRRLDNEEQSAQLAREVAVAIGMDPSFASRTSGLILATKHESSPTDLDAQFTVDVDLAGLGRPFEEFTRNGALVRQEYAWLEEKEYEKNRTALFRRFLGRPSIFCTEFFRSKYEQQARRNLQRALSAL